MLDPYITPCCDQKQLRYFFERVGKTGAATFFCEPDYPMSQFLTWVINSCPLAEFTLATQSLDATTATTLEHCLSRTYYSVSKKRTFPSMKHLNLLVGKETEVPDSLLNNPRVAVARDTFTYNFLLIARDGNTEVGNLNAEPDREAMLGNLDALAEKAAALRADVEAGSASRLEYEELEGAWIDYLLSSDLATSSKGVYYTLHGIVQQHRESVHNANAVTCVKGKFAYDEVMHTLASVLRTKKVKPTNTNT